MEMVPQKDCIEDVCLRCLMEPWVEGDLYCRDCVQHKQK